MGRNNPTTPGSSRPGEERTATMDGMSIGVLARIAARMRSQPRTRISTTPENPHAQPPRMAIGTQSRVPCAAGASASVSGNGRLISTIVDEIEIAAIFCTAGAELTWLPRPISNANGIRNLNDALSHNPYRTWALLFLKTRVSSATTSANTVDCQRWLLKSPIISICASFLPCVAVPLSR